MYPVDLFVVACQCLKLDTKPQVTANRYAFFACHGHNSSSIVLKNLQNSCIQITLDATRAAEYALHPVGLIASLHLNDHEGSYRHAVSILSLLERSLTPSNVRDEQDTKNDQYAGT